MRSAHVLAHHGKQTHGASESTFHRPRNWWTTVGRWPRDLGESFDHRGPAVASITKLDGVKRDRHQVYRVRWRERSDDGVTWINRERRVIGLEVAEQLRREVAEKHEGALALAPDRTTLGEAAELWLRH